MPSLGVRSPCNGTSLILKLDKTLLIVRGATIENIEVPQPRELMGSFSIRCVQ